MNKLSQSALVFALFLLMSAFAAAGPLDGRWRSDEGVVVNIKSQITQALVTFISPEGQAESFNAQYRGYSTLVIPTNDGQFVLRQINQYALQLTGPDLNVTLYR